MKKPLSSFLVICLTTSLPILLQAYIKSHYLHDNYKYVHGFLYNYDIYIMAAAVFLMNLANFFYMQFVNNQTLKAFEKVQAKSEKVQDKNDTLNIRLDLYEKRQKYLEAENLSLKKTMRAIEYEYRIKVPRY